jgi:hypothetical protein
VLCVVAPGGVWLGNTSGGFCKEGEKHRTHIAASFYRGNRRCYAK